MTIETGLLTVLMDYWHKTPLLTDALIVFFALYAMYKLVLLPSSYEINEKNRQSFNGRSSANEEFWNVS